MKTFVARQGILDRRQKLVGYELLFRASDVSNTFDGRDADQATSQVIWDSFFGLGMERVVGEGRGFVNCSRNFLVRDYASVLPPERTVIEILETVEPDREVLEACRSLKARGYMLALDDYKDGERFKPLVGMADIIKVDVRATGEVEQQRLLRRFRPLGVKMLAEKVETIAEFAQARKMGYAYFQGYFFSRPVIVECQQVPAFKQHHQELLREMLRPELDYDRLERVVKRELSLSYKLLQYINSALFGFEARVDSIRQALALLGGQEIRKWAALAIVADLGRNKPGELIVLCMVRARFCELLAPLTGMPKRAPELFLMGLFSLLDAILDRPIEGIVGELHLAGDIGEALLGAAPAESRPAAICNLVRAYEAARWSEVAASARHLAIPENVLPAEYLRSVRWADDVFQA